jgi:hypothetical protein
MSKQILERPGIFSLSKAWIACAALLALAAGPLSLPAAAAPIETGTTTSGGLSPQIGIIHVKNLNDSGPGSLRQALNADGPRIIVFDGRCHRICNRTCVEKPDVDR